jgi:hypothetical protein
MVRGKCTVFENVEEERSSIVTVLEVNSDMHITHAEHSGILVPTQDFLGPRKTTENVDRTGR